MTRPSESPVPPRSPQSASRGRTRDHARRIAYDALCAAGRRSVFVARAFEERITRASVLPADRGLAMEIALGVVRRRLTLDTLLAAHSRRPRQQIDADLWTLLQIGAYQLVLLDIPAHAAVHETVELAREVGRPRWAGFVNGVLRSVQRDLTDEFLDAPAAAAVPRVELSGNAAAGGIEIDYRKLRQPRFADPADDWPGCVSESFSMPRRLIERWLDGAGRLDVLRRCAWFATPGRMSLRVNPLRTDRASVLDVLAAADVEAAHGPFAESIRLARSVRVEDLPGFAEGWFTVQDESAMHAVDLLDPQPGERVLDLCAAPGGKCTHIAERMQDRGEIMAADVSRMRLDLIRNAVHRLRLCSIQTRLIEPDGSDIPPGPFDRILVDVPCSNTGVLGKRAEARWRCGPEQIRELAELQTRLLRAAAERVAPGGRIVYSTCSVEPEENRGVVDRVLAERREFTIKREVHHEPGRPADGGYHALLVRNH